MHILASIIPRVCLLLMYLSPHLLTILDAFMCSIFVLHNVLLRPLVNCLTHTQDVSYGCMWILLVLFPVDYL